MTQHQVISPLPGIFYRAPAPDQPAFVEPGAAVSADQTIGLVEIMKQFTEVKAGAAGVLASFSATTGGTVSPGEVVAVIETE